MFFSVADEFIEFAAYLGLLFSAIGGRSHFSLSFENEIHLNQTFLEAISGENVDWTEYSACWQGG